MLLCYGSQANLGIAEKADCFASKILTKMFPGCALSAHAVSTWLLPGWHKVFFFSLCSCRSCHLMREICAHTATVSILVSLNCKMEDH